MTKALRQRIYGVTGGPGVVATADPADIDWTLPRRVLNRLGLQTRARINVQFFPGGSWDMAAEPFEIHRYVEELFVQGVPVQESEQYRDMVARVTDPAAEGSVWGCRTVADVDRYFEQLFEMYEDMRRNGYRSHEELGGDPHDEVKVRLGRDGRLIKASGGNHRVSFAKLLGLDRIPVMVCTVHEGYLHKFARRKTQWDARMLADALAAAGLDDHRGADMDQLARRLEIGNVLRTAAALPGRRDRSSRCRLSEGSLAMASLLDDAYVFFVQPAYGFSLLPFLGG